MRIFAQPDEAAKRPEELISLAQRNDEVNFCRGGVPPAVLTAEQEDVDRGSDRFWALIAEGRLADDSTTSNHDEFMSSP